MFITLNWIKKYGTLAVDLNTLIEKLSTIGFESTVYKDYKKIYDNFVIGEVKECVKHQDASSLSVCKVVIDEYGEEKQ